MGRVSLPRHEILGIPGLRVQVLPTFLEEMSGVRPCQFMHASRGEKYTSIYWRRFGLFLDLTAFKNLRVTSTESGRGILSHENNSTIGAPPDEQQRPLSSPSRMFGRSRFAGFRAGFRAAVRRRDTETIEWLVQRAQAFYMVYVTRSHVMKITPLGEDGGNAQSFEQKDEGENLHGEAYLHGVRMADPPLPGGTFNGATTAGKVELNLLLREPLRKWVEKVNLNEGGAGAAGDVEEDDPRGAASRTSGEDRTTEETAGTAVEEEENPPPDPNEPTLDALANELFAGSDLTEAQRLVVEILVFELMVAFKQSGMERVQDLDVWLYIVDNMMGWADCQSDRLKTRLLHMVEVTAATVLTVEGGRKPNRGPIEQSWLLRGSYQEWTRDPLEAVRSWRADAATEIDSSLSLWNCERDLSVLELRNRRAGEGAVWEKFHELGADHPLNQHQLVRYLSSPALQEAPSPSSGGSSGGGFGGTQQEEDSSGPRDRLARVFDEEDHHVPGQEIPPPPDPAGRASSARSGRSSGASGDHRPTFPTQVPRLSICTFSLDPAPHCFAEFSRLSWVQFLSKLEPHTGMSPLHAALIVLFAMVVAPEAPLMGTRFSAIWYSSYVRDNLPLREVSWESLMDY